jgi:hypothetical protein
VAVEGFFEIAAVHFGYRGDRVHEESADCAVWLLLSGLDIGRNIWSDVDA